ncbi:MAG: hypothetical protein ACKPJJ_07275 [Planctomycetaceae bacterium]
MSASHADGPGVQQPPSSGNLLWRIGWQGNVRVAGLEFGSSGLCRPGSLTGPAAGMLTFLVHGIKQNPGCAGKRGRGRHSGFRIQRLDPA